MAKATILKKGNVYIRGTKCGRIAVHAQKHVYVFSWAEFEANTLRQIADELDRLNSLTAGKEGQNG